MINWQIFWGKYRLGNIILVPFSFLFYMVITIRRYLYELGFLSSQKVSIPVVVVGNINVGGSGKTPLVIALVKLLERENIRCAVISRGYKGSYKKFKIVNKDDFASVVGDEPLLIKLKCNCPVVVSKSRVNAAEIISNKFPDVDMIISDDGLQHYKLKRDIEICVINNMVGLGNGLLLPAGGLRETSHRLNSFDFVINNGNVREKYHYVLDNIIWFNINNNESRYSHDFLSEKKKILALSGIAHPSLFFKNIDSLGIKASVRVLPDHYNIKNDDMPSDKTILMTEKDWVKAKEYKHEDAWYLSVEAKLSESFKKDFLSKIKFLIRG